MDKIKIPVAVVDRNFYLVKVSEWIRLLFNMKKRKNRNNGEPEVPEISRHAKLKPLHRRPSKGAKLPQEQVKLRLEKHILTWFRYEAQRQNREVNSFINDALRQFIIRHVGDPEFQTNGLSPVQRAEVEALIGEMLATQRGPLQPDTPLYEDMKAIAQMKKRGKVRVYSRQEAFSD
jgi:uncharacterized protein (DUF4415 family)